MSAILEVNCYVSVVYARGTFSIGVTFIKKMVVDAIRNVAEGKFG